MKTKKKGRPSYKDVVPGWEQKVKLALDLDKSAAKAARRLGVDPTTVLSYAREYKIPVGEAAFGGHQPQPGYHRKFSCLYKWIEANPEIELPPSVKKIHNMTGCSIDCVKSFYKRERRKIEKFLIELPNLKEVRVELAATDGHLYHTDEISRYTYSYDRWNFYVQINAQTYTSGWLVFWYPDCYFLWKALSEGQV